MRLATDDSPAGCSYDSDNQFIRHPVIQAVRLPADTSDPSTLLSTRALHALGWQAIPAGWLIQTAGPLTAAQINAARQMALAAGVSIETRSASGPAQLRDWATAAGLLLALGVLAMTVGLIRSETASDLRTLTAVGASGATRRTLTGATAGALALLGALLGTAVAYLALIAWHRSDLGTLSPVPIVNILVIVIGLPLAATIGGWLLARLDVPGWFGGYWSTICRAAVIALKPLSIMQTGRMTDTRTPDPRDPRGLATDAPLLAAWLDFTRQAQDGKLIPMAVPGHKQRQDLVGAVIAGDAPLYGGLDAIKHADTLRSDAESRAARLWGADWCRFSVGVESSTHGNQAPGPGGGLTRPGSDHHADAAPLAAAGPGARRAAPGVGPARGWIRSPACLSRRRGRHRPGRASGAPSGCLRGVPRRSPPTSAPSATWPGTPTPPMTAGCPADRGRGLGGAHGAFTPTCRSTPSPRAPTRW